MDALATQGKDIAGGQPCEQRQLKKPSKRKKHNWGLFLWPDGFQSQSELRIFLFFSLGVRQETERIP